MNTETKQPLKQLPIPILTYNKLPASARKSESDGKGGRLFFVQKWLPPNAEGNSTFVWQEVKLVKEIQSRQEVEVK